MNFPHSVLLPRAASDRRNYRAMLASATARQASTQTAKAMRLQIADEGIWKDSNVSRMIHYFGSNKTDAKSLSGAFWKPDCGKKPQNHTCEEDVYQSDSTNSKTHELDGGGTGEQSNHVGHGILRTI